MPDFEARYSIIQKEEGMLGEIEEQENEYSIDRNLTRAEKVSLMRKSGFKDRDPNAKYMFKTD